MSITAENELAARQSLAETLATVSKAGSIIPAPIFFVDRADFWAFADPTNKETRINIETASVAAAWIYPYKVVDDADLGSDHSPLLDLTYEIYLFRSYSFLRADEDADPDPFGQTVLAAHNDFTQAWLDIKAALQGNRNMDGLTEGAFALAKTTSVVFPGFIENRVECAFIPNVYGFAVKMQETVQLMETEC